MSDMLGQLAAPKMLLQEKPLNCEGQGAAQDLGGSFLPVLLAHPKSQSPQTVKGNELQGSKAPS